MLLEARAQAAHDKQSPDAVARNQSDVSSPFGAIDLGKQMRGGAIIPPHWTMPNVHAPFNPEIHPAFRGRIGGASSVTHIRDAVMHAGWDRPVMIRQAHESASSVLMKPVMLNDWHPKTHGPASPPGDLQHGHGNHIPGFSGVFDRDLHYRHDVDRAPLVPLSGHTASAPH